MKHLGDITRIHGAGAPIVEVIIGGSPCQDLSVAGKRAGLAGERSGLFMDQIRIIKEMRDYDKRVNARTDVDARPRYMVWENVPGAFSSNHGEDFRAVLEETARIVEKDAVIPGPPNGKWQTAGCIVGDGWSVAWRVLDAQFWGVPQRRRRIALVADFGGSTAPEILFERESLSGDYETCGTARKGIAGDAEKCADTAVDGVTCIPINTMVALRHKRLGRGTGFGIGTNNDPQFTISAAHTHAVFCIHGNCIDRADTAGCNGKGWRDDDVSFTLSTVDRPAVFDCRGNGDGVTVPTITGDHQNRVTDYTAICMTQQALGEYKESYIASSLKQRDYKDATDLVCAVDCRNGTENPDINGTLQSKPNGGQSLNLQNVVRTHSIARRLTPLECERLQGYPDGWTDIGEWTDTKGKKHKPSDSARYKALGNSIALPPWRFVLSRLNTYLTEHTMASLFDGIGGFPLIWQELNGPGKCLWASEIEEFPIAVTKRRFET